MQSLSARSALALPLLLLAAAPHAQGQDRAIKPGYWDYTTSTILPGGSQGKQCVRPEQIDDFMSGPHNKHYHCTYPDKQVGGGKAYFDGVCVSKHGQSYKLSVKGTYSPTSFNLKGHIQLFGLPLPIAIDARWIGPDCPVGAK
jgi:hypothetical protein